ncbi:hypothetical protein PIB30_049513 [Stylosanthes scabra]|uniref:Uncharacterized protein n=1 Tax=Stylosanthes scabra TaxID=79078 RepID=A0ABU6UIT6_9FABA|nr:hypothetical protein [Stylosanthes scabra]
MAVHMVTEGGEFSRTSSSVRGRRMSPPTEIASILRKEKPIQARSRGFPDDSLSRYQNPPRESSRNGQEAAFSKPGSGEAFVAVGEAASSGNNGGF